MFKFHIRKQLYKLYALTMTGYFQIAGASWVALLAMRGFTMFEIGMLESIFHIVSSLFEIPSGVVADVFGRKKTLMLARAMNVISSVLMIWSAGFGTVAAAIGFNAISYNLESGTREALAYDSLKLAGQEKDYNRFASTEMMLYRITSSFATLCAGFGLWIGYKRAYAVDIFFGLIAMGFAMSLQEIQTVDHDRKQYSIRQRLYEVIRESLRFLIMNKRMRLLMFSNAFIGAVSTLVLFFLQAKLPLEGLPDALLGPALFIMGLGAAFGAKASVHFTKLKYGKLILLSGIGVLLAFCMTFTGNPYIMILGGFAGSFADDFLEVRTDVLINEMIPSGQRATLISVSSFTFSLVMIVMSAFMGSIM